MQVLGFAGSAAPGRPGGYWPGSTGIPSRQEWGSGSAKEASAIRRPPSVHSLAPPRRGVAPDLLGNISRPGPSPSSASRLILKGRTFMKPIAILALFICLVPSALYPGERISSPQETCRIVVERKATLGGIEDPSSVEIPTDVYVAQVRSGGWVVTEDGHEVVEYSSSGDFHRTLGRTGEGPGEFRHPAAVAVDGTDSIWVSDPRGRAVVFAPDGVPARTVLAPDLFQIEGFTESGLPYAMMLKVDRSAGQPRGWRYVQIWTREGRPLSQLGPGRFTPGVEGSPYNEAPAFRGVMVGDTLAAVPGAWEDWMLYWTANEEQRFAHAESVWRTLGLGDAPKSYSDGRPISVSSDGMAGYWVIGAVRRLSEEREQGLIQRARLPRGEHDEFYLRNSASVRNQAFDGAIIHLTSAGVITGGTTFDEYPHGFSAEGQFYSFSETDSGLIQINVWTASRDCG